MVLNLIQTKKQKLRTNWFLLSHIYLCRVIKASFVIVVLFTIEFSYSSSLALRFLSLIHS